MTPKSETLTKRLVTLLWDLCLKLIDEKAAVKAELKALRETLALKPIEMDPDWVPVMPEICQAQGCKENPAFHFRTPSGPKWFCRDHGHDEIWSRGSAE